MQQEMQDRFSSDVSITASKSSPGIGSAANKGQIYWLSLSAFQSKYF